MDSAEILRYNRWYTRQFLASVAHLSGALSRQGTVLWKGSGLDSGEAGERFRQRVRSSDHESCDMECTKLGDWPPVLTTIYTDYSGIYRD